MGLGGPAIGQSARGDDAERGSAATAGARQRGVSLIHMLWASSRGRTAWAGPGLAAATALLLTACSGSPEAVPPPKAVPVTVVAVAQRDVPVYGQYIGQTEAVRTVEVRARVEGFLERQAVPDGADVKAGDLLFVIDPRPFRVALNNAKGQLERDKARLVNAQQVSARYLPLYQQQAVSRQDLEQAQADERAAAATVETSRAAVDQAELNLGYTTVRSPVTGRMGKAEVRVGALVGKGEATLLATVSTVDPMWVNFSVSEREALQVWRGRQTELRARPSEGDITITLPDDSVYPHKGRLDFVDRAVDSRTGTLALRVAFPNPERLLQPGQYVRLRVLLEERAGALLVPQAAVQESQGSASVFVVGQDQKAQARPVQMGPRAGTLWVVENGLKPGEQVVVKGLQQLRTGVLVEPTLEEIRSETAGG
jgi:membrane fusion protein, multidrug efflux system